jgi:hypothetical protein
LYQGVAEKNISPTPEGMVREQGSLTIPQVTPTESFPLFESNQCYNTNTCLSCQIAQYDRFLAAQGRDMIGFDSYFLPHQSVPVVQSTPAKNMVVTYMQERAVVILAIVQGRLGHRRPFFMQAFVSGYGQTPECNMKARFPKE